MANLYGCGKREGWVVKRKEKKRKGEGGRIKEGKKENSHSGN